MVKSSAKGFFCVVYFSDTKKTCFYHKVYAPYKLAAALQNWKWMKVYLAKEDYFGNTKASNYLTIFDENNPVEEFTFKKFLK